jgi:Zn finger protein HypA/HybF involved in hydrogenase expression
MHETVFAKKIIDEASKQGNVKAITLEIGELAPVPANELVECLEQLVEWDIQYTETLSKIKCECGFIGHPTIVERGHDYFFIECPKCKEIPEVLEGQEIKIVSVFVQQ